MDYEPIVYIEDIEAISHEEWLQARRTGIGGSDAGVIMEASHFRTPRELWEDKCGFMPPENDANWLQKQFGTYLEELVARVFQRETGYQVFAMRKMFQHPHHPFMLADVDYFVQLPTGKTFILECKTCGVDQLESQWGRPNDTKIPAAYTWQCRHYMTVCNLDGAFICCLAANSMQYFRMRRINRDADLEQQLIEKEMEFWTSVTHRIAPAAGKKEPAASQADLTSNAVIDIPEICRPQIDSYLSLKEKRQEYGRMERELKTSMDEILADVADRLNGHPGRIRIKGEPYQLKWEKRISQSIPAEKLPALQLKYPEAYQEFVKQSESVALTFKKEKGDLYQ